MVALKMQMDQTVECAGTFAESLFIETMLIKN